MDLYPERLKLSWQAFEYLDRQDVASKHGKHYTSKIQRLIQRFHCSEIVGRNRALEPHLSTIVGQPPPSTVLVLR
jgi:hypothetical protein